MALLNILMDKNQSDFIELNEIFKDK